MKNQTLILLTSGEYSDYSVMATVRPLKSFNMGDAVEAFKAQWKPDPGSAWRPSEPGPSELLAWLNREGYVEDAETEEIHLGSYGELNETEDYRAYFIEAGEGGEA